MNDIIIAGNGLSRKSIDIGALKGALKCPLYACNLGYVDLPYDKVFAIDNQIINELQLNGVNYIDVPEDMKWEPSELHQLYRPRNNTGMVAIQYAINEGYKTLHLLGFDFLLPSENQIMSNVFAGHPLYGPQTACSLEDSHNRIRFMNWMIASNKDVTSKFYFPENSHEPSLQK